MQYVGTWQDRSLVEPRISSIGLREQREQRDETQPMAGPDTRQRKVRIAPIRRVQAAFIKRIGS